MEADEARRVLGVGPEATPDELRQAYRQALLHRHPDVGGTADATADVVAAYAVLKDLPPLPAPLPPSVVVDGDTIAADLPAGDLFPLLLEVADALGEIAYADADAGLLEVVVEIAGAGACSVVLNLQGRGNGLTEAWCTVEPLAGGPPPPTDVVVGLLAAGLRRVAA